MPTKTAAVRKTSTVSKKQNNQSNVLNLKNMLSTAQQSLKDTFSEYSSTTDTKLEKFFVESLKDIYWAEKHLVKSLPKMQKAAHSPKLKKAFGDHLKATETHVQRLEKAFEALGEKPRGKKCDAMDGLVEESKSIIAETEAKTATRDVGLILAAQKVEHYEIATYGGLAQLARTLGQTKVSQILEGILKEEKEADVLLTQIAENGVNYQASTENDK
jgi:ferritin-like metal-binding protein YciE